MKLKILGIEPAVSKAKKVYYKVTTNKGNMTAFDDTIVSELQIALADDKEINLEVVPSENGRYQNIRGFAMDDDKDDPIKEHLKQYVKPQEFGVQKVPGGVNVTPITKSNGRKEFDKDPVGLAVEVFNALDIGIAATNTKRATDIMTMCINLVKQAQEAFR